MATDNQIQYSGEYKLETLELITLNGNIDLVNNYVQIDLFESRLSQIPSSVQFGVGVEIDRYETQFRQPF